MQDRTSFRITPQLVLGLIIIFIGVIFTLHKLDILEARDYLRYWPLFLVIYGLAKLLQPAGGSGKFAGAIVLFIGIILLLDNLYIFDVRLWDFWPLIFVAIGGSMLLRSVNRQRESVASTDTSYTINNMAFLSGVRHSNNTQDFQGGELTAIMGGCEVDLRQASMKPGEAVLDVFAFWGGIEVRVPDDWSVMVRGTPLLGGIDDKTHAPKGGAEKRLVIKGYAIMGGVEITN